ncbi:hypothetical protein JOE26_002317 [Rhodococcus coprophilus]|nr:hypothetical protein [Rhodococcus coprophilus]
MSRTAEKPNRAPATSGPPLRALAMLLISLAILFAGIGMASLGGSDEDAATTATSSEPAEAAADPGSGASMLGSGAPSAAPNVAPAPAAGTPGTAATSGSTTTAAPATPAPVRVLNNSNVAGLAAQTASLLEDEGFTIEDTGNYSDGTVGMTTVYYGTTPGEEETALEVADALGVSAQPRLPGLADEAPGVIVIVAAS